MPSEHSVHMGALTPSLFTLIFLAASAPMTIHSPEFSEELKIDDIVLSNSASSASSLFRKSSEIVVRQVDLLGLQTLDDPLLYFLRDTGIVHPPYREYLNVVRNSSQIC